MKAALGRSMFDRIFTRLVKEGQLTVRFADGTTERYGRPSERIPSTTICFTDPGTPLRIVGNPAVGAGEAYMDGTLVMEEGGILDLLTLVTRNGRFERRRGKRRRSLDSWLRLPGDPVGWFRAYNQERRSRQNVAHHYDLSAGLYDLFLDADRQYSCAYYTDPANSLEQAQADKKAHIVAKLAIEPGHRVLDIGCGWGGMALYIHEKTGAEVLGITLSTEQLAIARERAMQAGVADKVRFELIDYRRLEDSFDRVVSVGMFEHVGPAHFRTFFAKCRALLAEDGVMLLHTIGRLGVRRGTDRWTVKYIFPGGYIPTLSEMMEATEAERLIATDVEVLRIHYALTLEEWLRRTQAHKAEIVALYDERFYRMWEFYLASSSTGFRWGEMVNFQVQYVRERTALPLTRGWMAEAERALA